MPDLPDFLDEIQNQGFEALVSKGVHALLFPFKRSGNGIIIDTSTNLLNGYPVGGFTTGGDSTDSEEYQDQLTGGSNKNFIGGATDPGDITFNTYFSLSKGRPKVAEILNSTIFTPQYSLMLGITTDTIDGNGVITPGDNLQIFLSAGCNYLGGNDIKGDYGKILGSSLKFKFTGIVQTGIYNVTTNPGGCGTVPKALYGAPYTS